MVAAFFGIVLWLITDNPNLAILFALSADLMASVPTIIKCYTHPESESWVAYGISAVGFGLGVLAIQTFTFENYAFIIYAFLTQVLMSVLAARKPTKELLHIEP
jgi:hypothetical protein